MRPLASWRLLLAIIGSTAVFGCASRTSPSSAGAANEAGVTPPTSSQSSPDFSGRLGAALGIFDSNEKDQALAAVARDAADAGDAATVEQALTGMFDTTLKDQAAYSAALRLAKVQKSAAATATANAIFDSTLRDKTLSKIAKGDTSE